MLEYILKIKMEKILQLGWKHAEVNNGVALEKDTKINLMIILWESFSVQKAIKT